MTPLTDLVALLYRADWTQLCLSARITSQHDREVGDQLWQHVADRRGTSPAVLRYTARPDEDEPGEDDPDEDEPGEDDPDEDEPGEDWLGEDWPYIWRDSEYRVLLAPGGRYRVCAGDDDAAVVAVCDGESRWRIHDGRARRSPADGPGGAFHGLVTPRWLLSSYSLETTGRTDIARRSAHQVLASPRAVTFRPSMDRYHLLDRVDVLVDAELGILLRSEQVFRGQTLELSQLHDLVIDPPQAADAGLFAPPPGMPVEAGPEPETFVPDGRGWQAAAAAAGLAAAAMGFAARHAPRRAPRHVPGDTEAAMPQDARLGPAGQATLEPASDRIVNLLHRTGLQAQDFTAELHMWADAEMLLRCLKSARSLLPEPIDGILGPDALWNALGQRSREAGCEHRTARLRVQMPGRYRIDYLTGQWRKRYATIACDGERTKKVFDDRIVTGPVSRLDDELASLFDPAWLLSGWKLSEAGEAIVGGRPGFAIVAQALGEVGIMRRWLPFTLLEVVVDAEFGILLRQTAYVDERPATCSELRAVTGADSAADSDAEADFRVEDAWGLRAVTDTGGPLDDLNLPTAVQGVAAAATLAVGGAIAGAVALTGWLEKHRARRG